MSDSGELGVEVRASATEGLGIFATRRFLAGELVRRIEYEREITDAAPLDVAAGERADHCAYPNGRVMLVAFPNRHMNHSCDPNAVYLHEEEGPVTVARRDIAPGEEIRVDYLINTHGGDSWPCRCGAERCRGETGHSFFDLPTDVQREYLPFLTSWFRARFADRIAQLERM